MISSEKKTKIFIFTSVHPLNDIRIFHKQAKSLAKYFSVELHAPAEFKEKYFCNITVYGLPLWRRKADRFKTLCILLYRVLKSKADIFHLHDPELIIHGIILKVLRRKKVLFDMHENTSQLINERKWIPSLLRSPLGLFHKVIEHLAIKLFDRIILAEKSYKVFIPNNSTTILNYPLATPQITVHTKSTDVVYVGGVLPERGAWELLKISRLVIEKVPEFSMKIIGPVSDKFMEELTGYIRQNHLDKHVYITGRMEYSSAMEEVNKSKIGIALLHPIKNYINSIPTKLFEYMQFGLPFIASDFEYWKNVFNGNKVGYFVPYNNTKLTAKKIVDLLTNEDLILSMGKQGKELVSLQYGWMGEEKKLVTLYEQLTH